MHRLRRTAILVALLGLVGLCAARPPLADAATIYPQGIAPRNILAGIAPGSDAGSCCWAGNRAVFTVIPPPGADTILIDVFIPAYALGARPQSFVVTLAHAPPQTRCCFGAGSHRLALAIPPMLRSRPLRITLSTAYTFVPARVGMGRDTRHLSVLLRGVGYLNMTTGERYDGDSLLTDSPAGTRFSLVLAVLGGLLALVLARRRAAYGFVALVAAAPFALYYSTHGTTVTLSKTVLIGVAVGLVLRGMRAFPKPGRTFWWLFAAQGLLVGSMLLSALHAMNVHAAVRETLKDVEFLATFAVAYFAYRADPDERLVRFTLATMACLVAGLALLQEIAGAPESLSLLGHSIARIAGPLEGPNQLGAYLGIVVPSIAAFVALRPAFGIERIALVLGTIATLLTFSRGGIAGLAVAFAILLLLRAHRERVRGVALAAGLGFVVLFGIACAAMAGHAPGASRIFGASADAYNGGLGTRAELWSGAYTLWREHPLLGVGPGNFELEISRFAPGVRTHANSEYFQVLSEQGLLGEAALLGLVALSVAAFMRNCSEPLPLAGFTVAIVLAFHQIVDTLWIYPKVGIMWWALIAIAAAANDRIRERAQ